MKQILLTQGKITLVDNDVYEWAKDYKWYAGKNNNTFYVMKNDTNGFGKRIKIRLHHCIFGFPLGGLVVDHIDGDGLNNQRSNLRIRTKRENQQNRKEHRTGKLFGCSFNKTLNKWHSRIGINGKDKHLGLFDTEKEAHEVYLEALAKLQEIQ